MAPNTTGNEELATGFGFEGRGMQSGICKVSLCPLYPQNHMQISPQVEVDVGKKM
jgi:hypothetical protein